MEYRNGERRLTEGDLEDLKLEKHKLKGVIELINREILLFIEKRKNIVQYILDYRKKNLEQFEDDEDKIIEYFDHERFVKEEAFKSIDRKLKELTTLSKSPYFGKVDFIEEDYGEDKIYVGRFGFTPQEAYEPIVVDWRAPVASLFYSGKLGQVTYKAPLGEVSVDILKKRQFIIKKEKLVGMFDSSVDVKDDILQLVLSQNSEQKLKDIIMTIQEEQDNIIRQPRNKAVVVNGVAGSGKTTIALHRVAYLLYNFRELLQDKVLILGPNSIFMEYISAVLPTLGEVGVDQQTFKDFALQMLDLDSDEILSFKDYMEKILSGDSEFVKLVEYKNSMDYIEELDKLVDKLNKEFYKLKAIEFNGKVIVTKEEIRELFNHHYVNMPLYRRTKKIRRIIFSKIKDARDERIREIQTEYKNIIEKATPEELKINGTKIDYEKRLAIRETIKKVIELKKSLTWLDNPDIFAVYKMLNKTSSYTIDDLAPLLYLRIKLEGIRAEEEIKHVVIDEAQDYSILQFRVIRELTGCPGMTIVGDSNQRIIPISGDIPMLKIKDILNDMEVEEFKLNKSYRATREIMEYANKYLKDEAIVPLVRKGNPVIEANASDYDELLNLIIEAIKKFKENEYESIGIICRDLSQTEKLGKILRTKGYGKIIDREEMIYTGGEVVMPSYLAKGLEFDAVIIVEDNKVNNNDDKVSYVMATRALHELLSLKVL